MGTATRPLIWGTSKYNQLWALACAIPDSEVPPPIPGYPGDGGETKDGTSHANNDEDEDDEIGEGEGGGEEDEDPGVVNEGDEGGGEQDL